MKILYLADANSVHTKKWCDFFLKKGYEIVVVSLGDGEIPGVRVHSMGITGFAERSQVSKLFTYFSKAGAVRQIVLREKPDIIHAHYATSYGILAARLGIHPYILSVWGSDVYDFPKSGFLQRRLLEYNLRQADYILSTSHAMKKETEQYTDKEILVTPFGVDTHVYRPMDVDKLSEFTVGTVKSFYPKYGMTYLIEGYHQFLQETGATDSKLLLVGSGPQESELRDLTKSLEIESRVLFPGFVDQEGVIRAFNQMDVAVFPSVLDSESFGVAAVEAGACGTPTIVSNVGGLPEATKPNETSLLVPAEDSKAIADALIKLYSDPILREKMGEAARDFVMNTYQIDSNFDEVDAIYRRLA